VRVQALGVATRAGAEPGRRDAPVLVAVGGVAPVADPASYRNLRCGPVRKTGGGSNAAAICPAQAASIGWPRS
jgi:hypothetical protein